MAAKRKLNPEDIPSILSDYREGRSLREIGKRYSVSHQAIYLVLRGVTWKPEASGLEPVSMRPRYCHSGQGNVSLRFMTDSDAREVRRLVSSGRSYASVARDFCVKADTVRQIALGITYKNVV